MMLWQKWVRAGLAVLVLGLAGGITWYIMRQGSRAEAPPAATPRVDEKSDIEVSGGEITRTDTSTGKVVFRIKFDQMLQYMQENRIRLVKATGTTMRGEQPVEFRADEADVKVKSGNMQDLGTFDEIRMIGNVSVTSAPGPDAVELHTSEALYNDLTGIMTTDKPAKMKRGAMSGSGTGATFDRDRAVLWLMADAKVTFATEGQGTLNVTSARAGLAEREKYFRFEENVRMERDGRVIQTDAAVANLSEDGTRMTVLELRGKSRVSGSKSGDGDVPNMAADDITITYGAESGLLERAVLMRAASLELPGGGKRSLAADHIDMGFAGDGTTVTVLDASGAVELKIPAERDVPAREVRAPRLEARGAAPKGLERAQFTGGVEFRELAAARGNQAAIDRTGKSQTLTLGLDGGFDKITNADFSGDVTFRDRDITGTAPEARYNLTTKRIELRGGKALARVVQEDSTINAKEIDLTLDPRKLSARQEVGSILTQKGRRDRKEARTSILEEDLPVNVTSRTLEYDGTTDRAVYSGDARLWQGADTVIQAETIVLDDKTGNLEARTNMRGIFLIREEPLPGAKPEPPTLTNVRADSLVYDEARRRATFRGKANMKSPEGDISAERIEIFLRDDGNTLDRAEAYDAVTALLEGGRKATGDRLTYTAKTRRYDMSGKPLRVTRRTEEKTATGTGQKCDETVGASLTFERSTDNVRVVAANGATSRTVPIPCTAIK